MNYSQARMDELRKLAWYQRHPVDFIADVFGDVLDDEQASIAEACADWDKVGACTAHGIGKTFTASRIGIWFLFTFERPKVITTAPTWRQVKDLLWTEVHTAMNPQTVRLDRCFWNGPTRLLGTRLNLAPDIFMTGEASDDARKMEGYHAPNIMYVVDEAKAVDDAVFDSIEGALTSGGATGGRSLRLYVSTPGECIGKHYRICNGDDPGWEIIHISGEGRSRPDPAWVQDKRDTWGVDSYLYRTRVLGLHDPRGGDLVMSPEIVEPAFANQQRPDSVPPEIGVDVARQGDDRTVICVRRGNCVLSMVEAQKRDTDWTVNAIVKIVDQLAATYQIGRKRIRVKVDDVGVGGGVTDGLRREGIMRVPIHASSSPGDEEHYRTRRDELWFNLADRIKEGRVDLSRVPARLKKELLGELTAAHWKVEEKSEKFVVEPTEKIKKRIRRSPDLATALILAFAGPIKVLRTAGDPRTRFFKQGQFAQSAQLEPIDIRPRAGAPRMTLLAGRNR